MHSRDITILIVRLWYSIVHYSNLFQYFFYRSTVEHPLSKHQLSETSITRTPKVTALLEYFVKSVCFIRVVEQNSVYNVWMFHYTYFLIIRTPLPYISLDNQCFTVL